MYDDIVNSISNRYIQLFKQIIGVDFAARNYQNINEQVINNILNSLKNIQ